MSIENLITFLSAHQSLALIVLFLGAYFETFIVTSFFIYGEFFFLAGAILAGAGTANVWYVMAVLYLGGFLGDHSSYWMGRWRGISAYQWLSRTPVLRKVFTERNYDRGIVFFNKYGGWSVFMGRFLGPVSWITPFIAGIFKLNYKTFTIFEIPAVILGIGQFLIVGYLFGANYKILLLLIQQYILIIIFVAICSTILLYYYRRLLKKFSLTIKGSILHFFGQIARGNRRVLKHTLKVTFVTLIGILILYAAILVTAFFAGQQYLSGTILPDLKNSFTSTQEIVASIDSTTYYQKGTTNVAPINLILVSSTSVVQILTKAGWDQSPTFIRNAIGLKTFIERLENTDTLPISDLYFERVPQDYAFEYPSDTLSSREHVRVWNFGTYKDKNVYLLSVSYDTGFDIYHSLSFIVPYHSFDPDIDNSRTFLLDSLKQAYPGLSSYLTPSKLGTRPKTHNDEQLYYTDGLIEVVEM